MAEKRQFIPYGICPQCKDTVDERVFSDVTYCIACGCDAYELISTQEEEDEFYEFN